MKLVLIYRRRTDGQLDKKNRAETLSVYGPEFTKLCENAADIIS